jgi:hypothetical protein
MASEVVPTLSYTTVRLEAQRDFPGLKLIFHEQESYGYCPQNIGEFKVGHSVRFQVNNCVIIVDTT